MGNAHSHFHKRNSSQRNDFSADESFEFHKKMNSPSLPPSPTQTQTILFDGRRYQNFNTKYMLPNDDEEQDRLVQVHFIYKHLFNGNFSAPVHSLLSNTDSRVLDIACGNGTWVLEMACEYPQTQFYGIDISPNYPNAIKPPNTCFIQHDALNPQGLPFPDGYFDFIFMRQVYCCFSSFDWTTLVKEIKRVLKPGGFIEFRDIDPILKHMGPTSYKLLERFSTTMKEVYDLDIDWAERMYDVLTSQVKETHQVVRSLRSGHSGPVCHMMNNSLKSALCSYRYIFETNYDLTADEYDALLETVVSEASDFRSSLTYYACWGSK